MPELVRLHRLEADADEQVRLAEEVEQHRIGSEAAADAEVLRMILRQDAFRLRRDEDWHAERLDETAHGCGRRVRIEVEAAEHDRPSRAFEFTGHALERLAGGM